MHVQKSIYKILSTAFTIIIMKSMFKQISNCSVNFANYLSRVINTCKTIIKLFIIKDKVYTELYTEGFLERMTVPITEHIFFSILCLRMCLSVNKFMLLKRKLLLFHLLAYCELKPCNKTSILTKIAKDDFTLESEDGFGLDVIPQEKISIIFYRR